MNWVHGAKVKMSAQHPTCAQILFLLLLLSLLVFHIINFIASFLFIYCVLNPFKFFPSLLFDSAFCVIKCVSTVDAKRYFRLSSMASPFDPFTIYFLCFYFSIALLSIFCVDRFYFWQIFISIAPVCIQFISFAYTFCCTYLQKPNPCRLYVHNVPVITFLRVYVMYITARLFYCLFCVQSVSVVFCVKKESGCLSM